MYTAESYYNSKVYVSYWHYVKRIVEGKMFFWKNILMRFHCIFKWQHFSLFTHKVSVNLKCDLVEIWLEFGSSEI